MATLTQEPVRTGQLKQITRVGQDAVEKAIAEFGLDKNGAQRVHEHGGEFAEVIHAAVIASLQNLLVSDKFKNEEVASTYDYLSGYNKPKGLTQQANDLLVLFPGLGLVNLEYQTKIEKGEVELPKHAEGWFAIPNRMKNPKIFGSTYSEALLRVFDPIKKTRNGKFYNYREGQLNEKRLRQSVRTQKFWQDLSEAQGNPDILIVPAQFGIHHRGRSVRRAREVFTSNEFGLGAFEIGIMLLAHPERLQHCDDLWIDCAGDEYDDPDSDVRFVHCPFWSFFVDKVRFDADYCGSVHKSCGSTSAFLPAVTLES